MVPAAAADRAGKDEDGRARTREVKLACLFTQTKLDAEGRPIRDPDTSIYVGTFAPADQFSTLVHAEARRRGAEHIRQLVVLGDGALWIWKLATTILPEATQIVDLYHAREHLRTSPSNWPPCSATTNQAGWPTGWPTSTTATSRPSSKATTDLPLRDADLAQVDTALEYFKKNAQRMRYKIFRELGMFIGSGVVEAGRKTLPVN